MNALIPMQAQGVDVVGSMSRGAEARGQMRQAQTQNALTQFMQEQGPALARGEQGAIDGYARFDPAGAFDMRSRINEAARVAQEQAAAAAEKLNAEQRAAEEANINRILSIVGTAYRQGPEAIEAAKAQYGQALAQANIDPAQLTYDTIPLFVAGLVGAKNGLKAGLDASEALQPKGPEYKTVGGVLLEMGGKDGPQVAFDGRKDTPDTVVNVDTGEPSIDDEEFYKVLDKKQGEMFSNLVDAGASVPAKMAMVDELERMLGSANTPDGIQAALQYAAGNFGIETDGLSTLQAAQAIINRMVPEQRQPGSGPMSDADLALFIQSLPRLINTREGNVVIARTMRGLLEYQRGQALIANMVASREMTPKQGREALSNLVNPLQAFRRGGAKTEVGGAVELNLNGSTYTVEPVNE
jgi:hypothetical protein